MDLSEKKVDIAHKLYQCRKTAKNLLGDRYAEKMAEYQEIIKDWLPAHNGEVLEAVLAMAECIKDQVYGTIYLMAAAVELIEGEKASSESKEAER